MTREFLQALYDGDTKEDEKYNMLCSWYYVLENSTEWEEQRLSSFCLELMDSFPKQIH